MLGSKTLALNVMGTEHWLHPETFYQVNLELNEILVTEVVERVLEWAPTAVLDLYSGAGNFSLPLISRGIKVTAIESNPSAIRDGRATVKRTTGQSGESTFLQRNADSFQAGDCFFDVAILDPPRRGAPGVLDELVLTRPKSIFYVSCNPLTLGRDLSPALAAGYKVRNIRGFDMFPGTSHIETLVELSLT